MGNEVENSKFHNFMRTTGAIAGAGTAGGAAFLGTALVANKPAADAAKKAAQNLVPMNSVFKEGAEKALDMYGIKYSDPSNPVRVLKDVIRDAANEEPSKFQQNIDRVIVPVKEKIQEFRRKLTFGLMEDKIKSQINKIANKAENTNNACCIGNRVVVNLDKSAVLTFHEMGHAQNHNCKGLGKALRTLRHPKVLKIGLGLAFASAILIPTRKASEEEPAQEQGFGTKIQRFLKKNCVGIAALSYMPVILEEGLASIKGGQIAKSVLSKDACKIVNKYNRIALLSYITIGLAITAGVFAAKKVREFIDTKQSDKK